MKEQNHTNEFAEYSFIGIYNAISKDIKTDRSLSGGDRIFVELTKQWYTVFKKYEIVTCSSGDALVREYISDKFLPEIQTIPTKSSLYNNILFLYAYKTYQACLYIFNRKLDDKLFVFSSSDFLPDVIPSWIAKKRNKNIKWIAAFYFFASSPFSPSFPYKGFHQRLRGTLYYYTQKVAYYLIKKHADSVILCNELDRNKFIQDGYDSQKIYPIYGGVDLSEVNSVPTPSKALFDAVFMARFHPQKGPLQAIRSWIEVLKVKPTAQLAMIGNGPLEYEVRKIIEQNNLKQNVTIFGFKDGKEKYKILKSAKIFIHSAIYETGGMAAAEGMAAGLPVIAYDHEGFDYCYPRGMIRVAPVGDEKKLAAEILDLLQDEKKYKKIKQEAVEFVQQWDWKERARFLLKKFEILHGE